MIRIDEIYNNTFWPWIERHIPGTRMFFCDPPGMTDNEHLFNHGRDDLVETDYVFFHDQEPIHLDLHQQLFDEVAWRNHDLARPRAQVIVSELGEYTQQLCDRYGWQPHYYFYHGWACQDWYRGYDKAYLIARARDREPTQTFMSPNRIIAGKRDHRMLFLYHVYKQGLAHNHISAPKVCTYENVAIGTVANKYCSTYPDIAQVLNSADLPRLFSGEATQQMTSCWLSNFGEAADSLVYVPTETVFFGQRLHITEKTFKAIALEMPFVLLAPAGSLEYMRLYGFRTFGDVIDESYDEEQDDLKRIERVIQLLKDLDSLSVKERQALHRAMLPAVEHNYNHFYRGGLADVLWPELQGMLHGLQVQLRK